MDKTDSLIRILERHLNNLQYRDTTPRHTPVPVRTGFTYAEIPEWELRQMLATLRNEDCDCMDGHTPNCEAAPL